MFGYGDAISMAAYVSETEYALQNAGKFAVHVVLSDVNL